MTSDVEIKAAQANVNGLLITINQKIAETRHAQLVETEAIEAVINRKFYHGLVNVTLLKEVYREKVNKSSEYHQGQLMLETMKVEGSY